VILEEDRPIVVPGALGMGKTTLALAAAHDPRVIARFGKERRFFVNLEPARNAEGVLSRELAAIEGLRLVMTVRGQPPKLPGPGARTLQDIERLGEADARALFLRHAGDQFAADPALPGLLQALDGHPLSIELLAANAQGKANLSGLAQDWKTRRARLLKSGKGVLYARVCDPYSIGLTHIRLARRAATPAEADEHREAARKASESIDRLDLIEKHLGKDG
jgi:hypothetical protein